jgi:hydroxymethylglutaryl-CoA reductase
MVTGRAGGKIILLGEHFVVHGVPAIAAGISNYCEVKLTKSNEVHFAGPKGTSPEMSSKAISSILDALKVKDKYTVSLGGNLPIFGGLGSSAAFCVAIVKAVAEDNKLKLSNEEINRIAYEGEKAFHGNPSGLDNTMATYGGAMLFTRGKTQSSDHFDPIKLGCKLNLMVGITNTFGRTAIMVSKVAEFKKREPVVFDKLCDTARTIVGEGVIALRDANLKRFGELMNINHGLLSSAGVSILENEKLVHAMRNAGALGAKITGGGGGGTCLALAEDEIHAKEILSAIKKEGFDGFLTTVG